MRRLPLTIPVLTIPVLVAILLTGMLLLPGDHARRSYPLLLNPLAWRLMSMRAGMSSGNCLTRLGTVSFSGISQLSQRRKTPTTSSPSAAATMSASPSPSASTKDSGDKPIYAELINRCGW